MPKSFNQAEEKQNLSLAQCASDRMTSIMAPNVNSNGNDVISLPNDVTKEERNNLVGPEIQDMDNANDQMKQFEQLD